MNIYLLYSNDLLKIALIAILSYITLVSLYKFIKGKEYSITDFRMSVFGLIFLFFKISSYLALVLIGEKTLSMELTYTIIAFISGIVGWNPAKENQATDRVHRIGQSRGVQVFKMVNKHTVEEHIHALIERKISLTEGVIGYDDQDHIKHLDREDLIRLLKSLS